MRNILLFCLFVLMQQNLLAKNSDNQFAIRGFHVDMRCQVMKPEALRNLVDELKNIGVNTIVMEWEATYPYENHTTITNKYGYSRKEVADFVSYCKSAGIHVIPLQQCFGHVEYILRHDRYASLREDRKEVSQLCPLKDSLAVDLFSDLFSDMARHHNSEYIHIGWLSLSLRQQRII